MNQAIFWSMVVGLGCLGAISGPTAVPGYEMDSMQPRSGQFQPIDQPLSHKIGVTVGGIALIGLELWWFLLNKPKSRQATAQGEVQAITVTVDGGYEPSHIVVQAGRTVRLNFDRQDSSSCLEEVRLPDFHIVQKLALNHVTPIEFKPDRPGQYEFSCGMNMFRGTVEVRGSSSLGFEPEI
jgi:plastocyanin domain-containing protein